MTVMLSLLKSNAGHLTWSAIALIMVMTAYLAQADKIEALSLELGELRSTSKYQTMTINDMINRCD